MMENVPIVSQDLLTVNIFMSFILIHWKMKILAILHGCYKYVLIEVTFKYVLNNHGQI